MTPLLVFKYWHCLQPRSWELRKYFPKFQTLFIDFLLFKLPPWISFFLFSLYFTHFLPELVYLWCFLYLLKYNPHLNKALLFVNALIIRFTERFIPLYKVRNFYCHSFLPICQTIDSVPIYRLWILKWDCVWIVKLKVTHNVCVLQFHPISCIIYPPFWAGKKQRTKGPMCVSKVFFSQLSTSWNRSPVIINFASPFNRYWDRGQMSHC